MWEAGGQINGYYHSYQLITEHLDPGAPTPMLHAEGIYVTPIFTPGTLQHGAYDWHLTPTQFPIWNKHCIQKRKHIYLLHWNWSMILYTWLFLSTTACIVNFQFIWPFRWRQNMTINIFLHADFETKGLSLLSWIHPAGLSRVWVGLVVAPLTTSQWLMTPESFRCWVYETPSCWLHCSDTVPCREQKGPRCKN